MKTIIIKLGGAAITNKQGSCQLAEESFLEALVIQIQKAYHALNAAGHKLILVHGGGSFGHPMARRYRIKEGWIASSGLTTPHLTAENIPEQEQDRRDQKAGFTYTRRCMLELHLALLDRLHRHGVPAITVSPFDYVETDGGDKSPISCFQQLAKRTEQCLHLGLVPLLYGDAVLDRSLGCTILSGDIIMHKLAMLVPSVTRCAFVTDVEGIYDADPKTNSEAKLIKHMKIDLETDVYKHGTPSKTNAEETTSGVVVVDVTGGMHGKVKWARQMILDAASTLNRNDLEVVICKATSKEAAAVMALEPVLANGSPIPGQCMTVFSLN